MSDNIPISTLVDLTNRAVTAGVIASADHEAWRNDVESRVANLNDAAADLENHHAGTVAPTDNTVRGKLWADTSNASRVVLKLDPDGSGADDEVLTRLEAYRINLATGGTATHKIGGVISINTTANARTTTGDFTSYTLPANTLDANGKAVRVTWWGTRTGTAGTFSLQPKLGTSNIGTAFASTVNSLTDWFVQCHIVRTGAATQDIQFFVIVNRDDTGSTTLASFDGTKTEDFTTGLAIALDLTAISAGTVTQEGMIVELLN